MSLPESSAQRLHVVVILGGLEIGRDSLLHSKNSECESPAIIVDRGSPFFPLTPASTGRINKQELAHANPLESYSRPLRIHFSTRSQSKTPGPLRPHIQNGAFKIPIHGVSGRLRVADEAVGSRISFSVHRLDDSLIQIQPIPDEQRAEPRLACPQILYHS